MKEQMINPDYLFEVSWEVCNKVGGIHTVISTKSRTVVSMMKDKYITIGPDVWKGAGSNPEFTEDKNLFKSWKQHAEQRNLKIKIGRWNIPGNPIAVLVDFTPFFQEKNQIETDYFLKYHLDSLNGQWEYIEPLLFGYAAGKVIECFHHHHLTYNDKVVAQFHEWMTGGGILYLKEKLPPVGLVFTTHATVLGRSIAGNNRPFYSKLETYNADSMAKEFNVSAKHSLEKISAQQADCFTTVSDITAKECKIFLDKNPEVITPNGFDESIVPKNSDYDNKRNAARKKLLNVAEAVLHQKLPEDSFLILKSGRYEFHNKGIDLFIDSLGQLNHDENSSKNIVAFIFIPASQSGARKEVLERMSNPIYDGATKESLTHHLQGKESDPIIKAFEKNNLDNDEKNNVKVIFAPVYMDGNDGIFDMPYYDLLPAFDISVFPSYYEPWGYTPQESLAFHIPTITTNLTGFGIWMMQNCNDIKNGISIITRDDNSHDSSVEIISDDIRMVMSLHAEELNHAREQAYQLSLKTLWKNFFLNYRDAYSNALQKVKEREDMMPFKSHVVPLESCDIVEIPKANEPVLRKIFVQTILPEKLEPLSTLAHNVWWTWNQKARELFESIDKDLWEEHEQNPVRVLNELSSLRLKQLSKDKVFLALMNEVVQQFENYKKERAERKYPLVAYFSMEYGICKHIRQYSGGLGILAGDYLKEASDSGMNMAAVGLLYNNGYFRQTISSHGEQIAEPDHQKITDTEISPLRDKDGNWIKISIGFPGRRLHAKAWKLDVGTVSLYLLDTDIPENNDEDKKITDQLYSGNNEHRLKQEIVLGIGGIRLLRALNIEPAVYHLNEGHSAFTGIERVKDFIRNYPLSFDEAIEIVRSSTLFTTHTPVAAGHDKFSEELLRTYLSHYSKIFNISWKSFMALGRVDENNQDEKFSMSYLAARLSSEINAVSKLHEEVSKKIFGVLWAGYRTEELNIRHVTNGIHYPTWAAPEWQNIFDEITGKNFIQRQAEPECWKKVFEIPDERVWNMHCDLKKRLINFVRKKIQPHVSDWYENPQQVIRSLNALEENVFIIGFARRFATYKRGGLLFRDLSRLAKILNDSGVPVMILIAGKAHPSDTEGSNVIKQIIEHSKKTEMAGKIFFLENYEMEIAMHLTRGCDIWLNTPERTKEASGTSGMKAALNGVLNLSVSDGWWAEAFNSNAGWALDEKKLFGDDNLQDEADADTIYRLLENEVLPLYMKRNEKGIPVEWISKMKNSISVAAPAFLMKRALEEYDNLYYEKMKKRNQIISANDFEAAKKIAGWKKKLIHGWESIRVKSIDVLDSSRQSFPLGENFNSKIILELNKLQPEDVGVEIVFMQKRNSNGGGTIIYKKELAVRNVDASQAEYEGTIPMTNSGVYEYGFRIFPKNDLLENHQDFPLVKWI